jgi:EGF-domain serine glucosyl/xylosyltransferase
MAWAEFATHLMKADGPEQNFIEVNRDWSDLSKKMSYFVNHQQEAKAIAERSHRLFNHQYLTPAAVNCYLRALFRGWAKVQGFEPAIFEGENQTPRGIPFEALAVSFPQEKPGEYGKHASN